jgi:hypothetical protein
MGDKEQKGDKEPKKEGFARKHLNPLRDVVKGVSVTEKQARQDINFAKNAGSEFVRRLKYMFSTRQTKPNEVDLKDFPSLLQFWGINEEDLPRVKKNMRVSIIAVFMMIIVATFGITQATDNLWLYCLLSALIIGGLVRIILTFWQLWVLSRGQYVAFKDWFTLNF